MVVLSHLVSMLLIHGVIIEVSSAGPGVSLDDPNGCFPTQHILFCDSVLFGDFQESKVNFAVWGFCFFFLFVWMGFYVGFLAVVLLFPCCWGFFPTIAFL